MNYVFLGILMIYIYGEEFLCFFFIWMEGRSFENYIVIIWVEWIYRVLYNNKGVKVKEEFLMNVFLKGKKELY